MFGPPESGRPSLSDASPENPEAPRQDQLAPEFERDMIQATDTIERSGFPLGFCFRREGKRPALFAGHPAETEFRVDARAMDGHQKEALVHEGRSAPAWRVVSDEGPYVGGSDMAPAPLSYFNAGLQADLLGHLGRLIVARNLAVDAVDLEVHNGFSFTGSFLSGLGKSTADPAEVRLLLRGSAAQADVARVVNDAVRASPALAAMTKPLENTFALYVNGIRCQVTTARPSRAADARDPLKAYARPPSPVEDGKDLLGIVTKVPNQPAPAELVRPSGDKFHVGVHGHSRLSDIARGLTDIRTGLKSPPGSHFDMRTDENSLVNPLGPSGLALVSAGIASCYMTQLLRYAKQLKYKVRAIRIVQYNAFGMSLGADGALHGEASPVDTHLFMHGDEPNEIMQKLLLLGAQKCYLHAALEAVLPPVVHVEYNGLPLAAS